MLRDGPLAPGLMRTLLVRMLLVALLPLAVIALVVTNLSDRLILERFQQESELLAKQAAKDLGDHVAQTTRYASLIAELQQTRDAFASGDRRQMIAELLPLKSRLQLDTVKLASLSGAIIAGAQDPRDGDLVPPELLRRIEARVDRSWMIDDDANGLTLRAVAPLRDRAGTRIGVVEVGTPLDASFLQSIQRQAETRSREAGLTPQLALAVDGRVRSSTFTGDGPGALAPAAEVERAPGQQVVRAMTIGEHAYFVIYTIVETQQDRLGVLGVYLPLDPVESAHRAVLATVLALSAALFVGIAFVAFRSARDITAPLSLLASAAQRIESGDLATRVEQRSPHEIGTLERAFATMTHALAEREEKNRELVAELQVQALSDALTGLPNRILFQDRLRQAILAASRFRKTFAVAVMDLDRFKEINDTFGHQIGDRLLVSVGDRVRRALRESDTVARFGGDEFAVLLPTADGPEQAVVAVRKIQRSLEAPFLVDELTLNVDGSTGITLFPDHGSDPSTLIKRADAAMYVAKRNKSGYALYTATDELEIRDRLLLMGEFRQAIERDELLLHFQPEVEPLTRRIRGFEALVRWRHPTRGLVGPDRFIPFVEQTGLIRPLTHWVLNAACSQSATWRRAGRATCVAVNLSARDFEDPELPDRVGDALRRWGVDPGDLKLEITESALMAQAERSLETLTRLRDMGLRLAIDDFGTGYSSLAYLKRFPVHEIKIDRSFVADICADQSAAAIVRSTIDLAHRLGRTVVAEGAEDGPTVDLLAAFGCDAIQGFHYSRPVAPEEVARWLVGTSWVLPDEASGAAVLVS